MKRYSFFFIFLWMLCGAAAGDEPRIRIETPVSFDEQAFREELSLVSRRAFELRGVKFSRIKKINDSYRLTTKAILLLAEQGDVKGAIPLLREAAQKFDGNRLAYLLLGSVYERLGQIEEAALAYGNFHRRSLTLLPIERRLITGRSVQVFTEYVKMRFTEWQRPLPRPRVSLELQKMRSLVMIEHSGAAQIANLTLPLIVVGGLVLFLLALATGQQMPRSAAYFFVSFYLLIVAAYLLWAAHFFMGLPFFKSVKIEFTLFLAGGSLAIASFYAGRLWLEDWKKNRIADMKRCRHCREVVLKLAAECPHCRRPC